MAHGLDQEKIDTSLRKVIEYQLQIETDPKEVEYIKLKEPKYQLVLAIALVEGFLGAYLKDARLVSEITIDILKRYDQENTSD